MEPIQLPIKSSGDEQALRSQLVTAKKMLVPSIRLQGSPDHYAKPLRTLNDADAVERAKEKGHRVAALKLHGLPVAEGSIRCLRRYVAVVFQTQVWLLYRSREPKAWLAGNRSSVKQGFRIIPSNESNREIVRVKRLCIRALYALGLDYGVVKVGVRSGNRTVVLDIYPTPKLNREMENAFCQAFTQYMGKLPRLMTDLNRVTLGADPEFIMKKENGELVMASNYFPRFGLVGCDAIWYGQNRSARPLVEIRPKPTPEPRQLVIRLYKGLIRASQRVKTNRFRWLAGALPHPGYPLGGHIHFSGVPLNFKLLRALDHYLALPLVLIEDPQGVKRRPKYGYLGDFRTQFHGGFEYRTLPSWLISPTVTKGVLAAAKLIAAHYPVLKSGYLQRHTVQKAYYEGDKEALRSIVQDLLVELKGLKGYQQYRNYLDPFFQMVLSGKKWNESKDIRLVWKITSNRS